MRCSDERKAPVREGDPELRATTGVLEAEVEVTREEERAWLKQWEHARDALDRVRTQELLALTPARALAASDALLALVDPRNLSQARRTASGFVEQQRAFRRLAR